MIEKFLILSIFYLRSISSELKFVNLVIDSPRFEAPSSPIMFDLAYREVDKWAIAKKVAGKYGKVRR
jgi:hypothetical protein